MPSGDLTLYASGYSLLEKTKLAQSEQRRQGTLDSSGRPKVERFFIEDTYSVVAPRAAAPSVGVSTTTFTSGSFATDFATSPTPTVFATPSRSPSIGFPSGFIPDFSSGATEFADTSQAAGGGPDLGLDRGYVDEPNRLAGRSTSPKIALLFTEDNFLQSSFSGNLGLYTIGKYLQLSTETPIRPPVDIKDVNNPAWKILNVSDRLDNIHVRLDWERSADCGGSNDRVQSAALTIVTKGVINRLINFQIDGKGEAQNILYEVMELNINNRRIFRSGSQGGEDGCTSAIPVIYSFFESSPTLSISQGVARFSAFTGPEELTFIRFGLSTRDPFYHVNAYYDLKINFDL
jgi:hypothetical protein